MTATVTSLIAVRVITPDDDETFDRTVEFYAALLGQRPQGDDGTPRAIRHARFDVGGVELVIAKEPAVTPEAAGVQQGPVWLCFASLDAHATHDELTAAGTSPATGVTDTSFGTTAFFINDPGGLAIYVGTDWR